MQTEKIYRSENMNSNEKMKVAAMFSAVSGRDSCFIETRARAGAGKTTEDEKCLACFCRDDVVFCDSMTEAAVFKHEDSNFYDKKILMVGDVGNSQFSKLQPMFNVFKRLVSEKKAVRVMKKADEWLFADSLCCMYTTTKKTIKDYQIISRSLQFSLNHDTADEEAILDAIVAGTDLDFAENDADVEHYKQRIAEIRGFDIGVDNPFRRDILEAIRDENVSSLKRKLKQLFSLFDSFVLLNCSDSLHDGCTVTATKELFDEFMQYVFDCSLFEENVEKEFYHMLVEATEQYRLEKIASIDDFVLEETGQIFEDMTAIQRKSILSKFFKKYMLLSRSKHNTDRNVFFTLKNVRDIYKCSNAYKNVSNVKECLEKLISWGLVGRVGLKHQGSTVYYLKMSE